MLVEILQTARRYARHFAGLDYADTYPVTHEQRRTLRHMYLNGIFSNFSDGIAGNYTSLFMVALNATNIQIGLLATITQALAALAPMPGAFIAERTRAYRATILYPSFTARIGYILLAILPFLQIGQPLIAAAVVIFAMRSFLNSMVGAPWTAAMAQIVPLQIRARYFSARNFAGGVAVIIATLVAGEVITLLGFPSGYQVIYLAAAFMGIGASYIYSRVPGKAYGNLEHKLDSRPRSSTVATMAMLLKHKPFVRYTICACALAFAVSIGGPFISLYQIRVLHFSAVTIGIIVSVELGVNILMQLVYGSVVIPRIGDYRAMRALRFATALVPFAWLFVADPWAGAAASVLAGVCWSGHDLANFNGLLEITPEQNRAAYIALHTVTISLSAAMGPAIGGVLTEIVGYHPLFIASGVLRFVAAIMLTVLVKDWAVNREKPEISATQ